MSCKYILIHPFSSNSPEVLAPKDLSYPDQRIKALAGSEGIEVVNLALPLEIMQSLMTFFCTGLEDKLVSDNGTGKLIGLLAKHCRVLCEVISRN